MVKSKDPEDPSFRGREEGGRSRPRLRSFASRLGFARERAPQDPARGIVFITVVLVALLCLPVFNGCDGNEDAADAATTSSSVSSDGSKSGDIEGQVGDALEVGSAFVTVRALQSTFQPAMPAQRLSDQSPTAPEAGESFYQAYVRVENRETDPIRVDPNDFACAIGDTVATVEPTRSGPLPRSLLKRASLDLLLTFKGPAGYEPVLLYDPVWYRGTVRVSPMVTGEETTTTS